jgi:uncharacterized membrane protein
MPGWLPAVVVGAAAVGTALLAGLLWSFGTAVLPGLRRAGDDAFVVAFRGMNAAILNPGFLLVFTGVPVVSAAAVAVLAVAGGDGLPWAVAGLVGNLVTVAVTTAVHVPLNRALDGAPVATPADRRRARAAFDAPWTRAHRVRTAASVLAAVVLVVALAVRTG